MVEGLIESGAVEGKQKKTLALRAAEWYRDRLGDAAAEERCMRWALEVDSSQSEVHERLVALLRAPRREADLVRALREFAEIERDADERKAKLREAAEISRRRARPTSAFAAECYEALLGSDPEDTDALDRLAVMRSRARPIQGGDRVARAAPRARNTIATRASRCDCSSAKIFESDLRDSEQAVDRVSRRAAGVGRSGTGARARSSACTKARAASTICARCSRRSATPRATRRSVRRCACASPSSPSSGLATASVRFASCSSSPRSSRCTRALRTSSSACTPRTSAGTTWSSCCSGARRMPAKRAMPAAEVQRLRRLADIYETRLGDRAARSKATTAVHARDASDRAALEALVRLLLAAERWPEAAQAASTLLAQSDGQSAIDLALQLAQLADQRLQDFALAERALLKAQSIDANHEESRKRLR